jgi:Tol biopolymer transport system component
VQLVSRKNDLGESATHARFSPDGKFVAYAWTKDGVSSIWIKQVSGGEPFTNKSAQGIAATPIWSPDGQQIAFLSRRDSQNGIWIMPAFGGAATLVKALDGPSAGLVGWSKQSQIYFVSRGNLMSVDINSQQVSEVVKFESTRALDRSFGVSPDGERIAYSDVQNGQRDLFVVSKSGGDRKQLTNDQPADTRPVWTPDGESVVYSSSRNGIKQLFLAYLDGRPAVQLTVNDSNSDLLDISPDGSRILYATTGDEADLWSVNVEQGTESKITADIGLEFWPDVSPDGKRIAFQQTKATAGVSPFTSVLVVKSIAGSGDQNQLSPDGFAPRWSPDGKQIAFLRYKDGQTDLWVVAAEGGQTRQLTNGGVSFGGYVFLPYNRVQTHDFQWSTDGRRLIYCAEVGGVANVWQVGVDGGDAKQLTDNTTKGTRFFDPIFSPKDESVAWIAMMPPQAGKKLTWSVWTIRDGKSQMILESESILDLVGWSQSGSNLFVKTATGKPMPSNLPLDVELTSVPTQGGESRPIAQLKDTYFQNIQLATGRDEIAFVTRQGGTDSLHLISATGASKTLLTNNDAQSYLSALAWSIDRKNIYYGKQVSWTVLSMIENFKTK